MGKWIAGAGIAILIIAAVSAIWSDIISIVIASIGLGVVLIGVIWWLVENVFCKK